MKLMTKELIQKMPPLYSQDGKGEEAMAVVKFFDPVGSWTWYASEGSYVCPDHSLFDCKECPRATWTNYLFFGVVSGAERESGYFSLDELQGVKLRFGLGIERDLYWSPKPLKECK